MVGVLKRTDHHVDKDLFAAVQFEVDQPVASSISESPSTMAFFEKIFSRNLLVTFL